MLLNNGLLDPLSMREPMPLDYSHLGDANLVNFFHLGERLLEEARLLGEAVWWEVGLVEISLLLKGVRGHDHSY